MPRVSDHEMVSDQESPVTAKAESSVGVGVCVMANWLGKFVL